MYNFGIDLHLKEDDQTDYYMSTSEGDYDYRDSDNLAEVKDEGFLEAVEYFKSKIKEFSNADYVEFTDYDGEGLLSIAVADSEISHEELEELLVGLEYYYENSVEEYNYKDNMAYTFYIDVLWEVESAEAYTGYDDDLNEIALESNNRAGVPSFNCPVCNCKKVYPINRLAPKFHEICVCDGCGQEFYAVPNMNGTMGLEKTDPVE